MKDLIEALDRADKLDRNRQIKLTEESQDTRIPFTEDQLEDPWDYDLEYHAWSDDEEQQEATESIKIQQLNEVAKKTLQSFARTVQKSLAAGHKAVVNTQTQCVDICTDNGAIIAQVYPKYKSVEKEYKSLMKVSRDEIKDDDEIYVKRNKTGKKNVINGIGTVKRVSGVYDSIEDAMKA